MNAAQAAQKHGEHELATRLCQAEVQAVLEKYAMTIGIKRVETQVEGRLNVEYLLMFVPRPTRGNGSRS